MLLYFFSYPTYIILSFCILCLLIILTERKTRSKFKDFGKSPPGPKVLPFIGSLWYLFKFNNSIEIFSNLSKKFGDVVYLRMGVYDAIVVSGYDKFKQVLITKGGHFDARVNFKRYDLMFGNNKENALAFANFDDIHRRRREIVSIHTFPKGGSYSLERLMGNSMPIVKSLMDTFRDIAKSSSPVYVKGLFSESVAKIFLKYFCNLEINEDNRKEFEEMFLEAFEIIFQDVNKSCIGDLYPLLLPLCNKSHLPTTSHKIREFLDKHIIEPRRAVRKLEKAKRARKSFCQFGNAPYIQVNGENISLTSSNSLFVPGPMPRASKSTSNLESLDENNNGSLDQEHLLDALLDAIEEPSGPGNNNNNNNNGKKKNQPELTLNQALYALEDILGGHVAISHFMCKVLSFLAQNPQVQDKIRKEVEENIGHEYEISLQDKLPYTEATIMEAARYVSSGIVPHCASQDTFIDDYKISKGTVIFFNNYDLNFSPKYWYEPAKFEPERFLTEDRQTVVKPEIFFPFSTGKRQCLGYKMVFWVGSLLVANMCRNFKISLDPNEQYINEEEAGTLATFGDPRFILEIID